ncbi:MAG: AAA family ATPase [Bacteroidetes bacterium]|nr:AAA family ATPase [Bacteroidota bacterium]MBS1757611.1 AAA family ATPase [Bacteroidota bacterium]
MESKDKKVKRVVVIGPESTGKTTLCQKLAAHFNTQWAPEYAREYLDTNGTDYTIDSLYQIALGQIANEEKAVQSLSPHQQLVLIDTDMVVMQVWSEYVFNQCDNRILTAIANRKYDLYLLCNTDAPWVKDNLREYPDLKTREKLFYYYKEIMVNQHTPWHIISGNYEERLQYAIECVNNIL